MGEGQREGDTESETGSRLWAIHPEPNAGLKLTDREIVTWAEVPRLTDWVTQAPHHRFFNVLNTPTIQRSLVSFTVTFYKMYSFLSDLFKIYFFGVPGWLSRLSVRLRPRSRSHTPWVRALHRGLCWQLRAWSPLQILCLPISLPLPRSCSVSLCPTNKWTLKKKFFKENSYQIYIPYL